MVTIIPITDNDEQKTTHIPIMINNKKVYAICEGLRSVSKQRLGAKIDELSNEQIKVVTSMVKNIIIKEWLNNK